MLNKIRIFLMPESSTSLKLVFDNIRNYAICGALLVYALWVLAQSAKATAGGSWAAPLGIATLQMSQTELRLIAVSALLLTALLSALNLLQTWLLLFYWLLPPLPIKRSAPVPTSPPAKKRSPATVVALIVAFPIFSYWVVQMFLGLLATATAFVAK